MRYLAAVRERVHVLSLMMAGALLFGFGGGYVLFSAVRPGPEDLYQGLWREATNKISGGRYRVMVHCPLNGKRAGHFVRAASAADARQRLAWQLPACELVNVAEQDSDGIMGAWYRGDYVCPSNFYKKAVGLSAPDLDGAVRMAAAYAQGCRVDFADQVECPLFEPGCSKESVDLREARQLSRSALR